MIEDLRKLANRGSRSLSAVEALDLDALSEALDAAKEMIEELIQARDEYEQNDPKEASGTYERESAAEARTEAWDTIQEKADELADALKDIEGLS